MRYTGAKNRIARREGVDLELKTAGSNAHASMLRKLTVPPGQHGAKRRRKQSERGKQLREKQKLRFMFGISEHKLKKYFQEAKRRAGNTGTNMGELLELRLDNVVFRAGLAPTRASARQLVNHGHFKVNNKLVTIPSYQARMDDVVSFASDASTKIPYVETQLKNTSKIVVEWITKKGNACSVTAAPTSEDIEKQVDIRSVIEYYSR
jgi:small subunit ribosomal protein S4